MTIQDELNKKNISIYRLAKMSEVPYATLNDICNGKASPEKCSAETIYRICQALEIPMEDLLASYVLKRSSFENFKSTICHRVKEMGDIDFIIDTLESGEIRTFYDRKWYPESLYLLAMIDYLSRENEVPICSDYDDLRTCKLEKPIYPTGLKAVSAATKSDKVLKDAVKTAIPEFKRFNIIEEDIRNVI